MITYVVAQGDTLYGIADMFLVPRGELIAANPQITDINLIAPGQVVNVPGDPSGHAPGVMPGGSSTVAASGMNMWAVGAAVLLGVIALKTFLQDRPRGNPGRRKGKKKPFRLNASHVVTAYQVGTALSRRYAEVRPRG